ncbi:hypothetical protein NQ317_001836 [Molorchus minor]|uniref:Saposin B-type domain-containing protein n=1 Tax=Molorchus minor TaxID=1323400 RepID=A0ABQ9JCR1_9CUCU|nr:hypothetical protein NQ317_001836 [Molorchus minor]
MLDLYFPEKDYNIAELMICRTCVRPFASYSKFATVCATTEEYITNNCKQINTNSQDLVECGKRICNSAASVRGMQLTQQIVEDKTPSLDLSIPIPREQQKANCVSDFRITRLQHCRADDLQFLCGDHWQVI